MDGACGKSVRHQTQRPASKATGSKTPNLCQANKCKNRQLPNDSAARGMYNGGHGHEGLIVPGGSWLFSFMRNQIFFFTRLGAETQVMDKQSRQSAHDRQIADPLQWMFPQLHR